MSANMKYMVASVVVCAFVAFGIFYYDQQMSDTPKLESQRITVVLGNGSVSAEIAATDDTRQQGLSGRTSLREGEGMWFVFDAPGLHRFWMKDMHFPIDIIWIDQAYAVLHVAASVTPETYPESFGPPSPALYVLEVPAGYTKRHGIAIGQKVVVK